MEICLSAGVYNKEKQDFQQQRYNLIHSKTI